MATATTNYGSWTTITIAPENVASSSSFVAGVESSVIDNTTNKFLDVFVTGTWTSGTTPTTNTVVMIYAFGLLDGTTYPDVMDGTSSAETLTSAGVGSGFLKLLGTISVDSNTSNRAYPFGPASIAAAFGGVMPEKWSLFITHNTGVNSNSTAGNHVWKYQGIKFDVT